jgi:hypothetical protein
MGFIAAQGNQNISAKPKYSETEDVRTLVHGFLTKKFRT